MKRRVRLLILGICILLTDTSAFSQAWKNCIPDSIALGGCDSIAPGGGKSIAPGGGLSIGPGGGLSIEPGGGQSIGPGGGQALDRNRTRGLDPDTMRPYRDAGVPSSINNPSTFNGTPLPTQRLKPGMSKDEVYQVLGSPSQFEYKGSSEAWHFCKTGVERDEFLVILFNNGRTVSGRTYVVTLADTHGKTGNCAKFARLILN